MPGPDTPNTFEAGASSFQYHTPKRSRTGTLTFSTTSRSRCRVYFRRLELEPEVDGRTKAPFSTPATNLNYLGLKSAQQH